MHNVGKRILAISMGGTIAMESHTATLGSRWNSVLKNSDHLSSASALMERLELDRFREQYDIHLVPVQVANLDSNNVHPVLWSKVVKTIIDECRNEYAQAGAHFRGVIITTGTDTKEFFSSAIAAAFGTSLNMPIVLASAQSVPDLQIGDARTNLARSLAVIGQTEEIGTLVVNGDEILDGSRIAKISESSYKYMVSDFKRGEFLSEGIIVRDGASIKRRDGVPPFEESDVLEEFADNVMAIRAIPGSHPGLLKDCLKALNGLIIISNGPGNLPHIPGAKDDPYSYKPLLEHARTVDLPVLVTTPFLFGSADSSHYEAGALVHDMGCLTNAGFTMGGAVAMFYLGLKHAEMKLAQGTIKAGQKRDIVREFMAHPRFALGKNPRVFYPLHVIYSRQNDVNKDK